MEDSPSANTPGARFVARITRQRFMGLWTAVLGAVLGLGPVKDAAACRKKSARCEHGSQCCSNRCRRGFCYPRRKK